MSQASLNEVLYVEMYAVNLEGIAVLKIIEREKQGAVYRQEGTDNIV